MDRCQICNCVAASLNYTDFGELCKICSYNPHEAFFEQVRDKKIRWNCWNNDIYFVPKRLERNIMYGNTHRGDRVEKETEWYIESGFYKNSYNNYWVLVKDDAGPPGPKACQHEFVKYVGLYERYEYCRKCDVKR